MSEIIIKTTRAFHSKIGKIMTQAALQELGSYLILYPEQGQLIVGTGGVRKLRWKNGFNTRGKSGGVRIIYHYSKNTLILLLNVYSKSEKENLTKAERNELKQIVPALVKIIKGTL